MAVGSLWMLVLEIYEGGSQLEIFDWASS